MARKIRTAGKPATPEAPAAVQTPAAAEAPGRLSALVLCVMLVLTPATGVPFEELLQDTYKSMLVSFATLLAACILVWQHRRGTQPLRWHGVVWLPLLLMACALGGMAWSHTYLAGVEAVRWFVFALLLWVGLNVFSRERLPALAWSVHLGAVGASLWIALQFWSDLQLFPQGPNPASTFVNRNFFSEFAVCALPFTALLLARARQSSVIALLSLSGGLIVTAVMMTGTRSALVTMWLQLLVVMPLIAWKCRDQLAFPQWSLGTRILALGVALATVTALGSIPTGNPKLAAEQRGATAIERAFVRTASVAATADPSVSMRVVMWKDTLRMAAANPVTGVGAGAWESEIPVYQSEGAQLENDYYAHNEVLQLIAEYGLVGWLFLLGLLGYLAWATRATWRAAGGAGAPEAPWRAMALCSLMALLLVSNAGFPWRLATTGALFAVALAVLAASDARLALRGPVLARPLPWSPPLARGLLAALLASTALATYISYQAALCEYKIVRATRIALAITASGRPLDARWNKIRAEMLTLIREGIAINPHYRKITPMVADELARWGDWANAVYVWESVIGSRPYIVAILANLARGHVAMGNLPQAQVYAERALSIQPFATGAIGARAMVYSRMGDDARALALVRPAVDKEMQDFDLMSLAFGLAMRSRDYPLAERALQVRNRLWPQSRLRGLMQLGELYATAMGEPDKAFQAYSQALQLMPPEQRAAALRSVAPALRGRLEASLGAGAPPAQTSASSR